MPKRSSKPKKGQAPADLNLLAAGIVQRATGEPEAQPPPTQAKAEKPKDPLAVELGRRGGLKGGKARARKLSPARRKAIARKAARTRWAAKSSASE